jgi:ferredoxin-NADP reductase
MPEGRADEGMRVLESTVDRLSLRVISMTLEADDVLSLTLSPTDAAPLHRWDPGAHLAVHLPGGTTRQYSLCGDPDDSGRYRIAVLREPVSRGGSSHVHETLRVGDIVEATPPRNHFELDDASGYVFVAGGIGITPLLPMLERAERDGRPWHLYYYGRARSSMAFLDKLERHGDRVTLVTRHDEARPDLAAIVRDLPAGHALYACGPGRLTSELAAHAEAHGVNDRLRTELFAVPETDVAPAPDADSFVVRLETSGLELTVPPGRSILDVVLEAGIDVLHDCAEGICGSCETAVVSGEPDHRDYVLTTQEKADNSCMMICVSRSSCPVLVLEL